MAEARTYDYAGNIEDVLRNAHEYHTAAYAAETFRGPSLYFHERCMATLGDGITEQRLEYIYGTLASWGMHRMGKGGSKMRPFADFRDSVLASEAMVAELQSTEMEDMNAEGWGLLRQFFRQIRVMATGTTLVGNSKVMAHLTPNLVPPIDRQYTLKYLRGSTNIRNDLRAEWLTMRDLLENFFYRVALEPRFTEAAAEWASSPDQYPWDTSALKIVDNLLIGAMKARE